MVIAVIIVNYSNLELKSKLEQRFADSADLTIRELTLRSASAISALVITMEGLVDKQQLAQSVINPLLPYDFGNQSPDAVGQSIFRSVIASADAKAFSTMEELITYITSGFAVIAVDGALEYYAVGVQGFAFRGVSEPESEVVQRGSREGFSEPLQINMSMIRRRLKSPELVFEQVTVGSESQTQLMLCYLKSKVSQELLNTLRQRLKSCELETVLASGYLSDYLEDEKILVPRLFVEEFQGVDDYSNRSYYAAFIRFTKYLSFFAAVFLPGLYVALAQFHPEYFPTQLLIQTSESLAKTPFPVMTETLGITLVYEIMKEAGLRIPKSLGHAVSIVGALVIGESAVTAGIISSSTLMVVATAAICSYVTSSLYPPIMVLRFVLILVGGLTGLWGITLATAVILISVCSKSSLGVPYMSSLAPFSLRRMRDVFIRAGWKTLGKHTIRVQKFVETEVRDAD